MATVMLVFVMALVFAIGATPVARRLALRAGIVAQPGGHHTHQTPVPLLGGLAMYGAFLLALMLFADHFYISQVISIVVGATLVSFLGIWDDRVGLRSIVKLAGQVLAALILVISGVLVDIFHQPLLDGALTLFWVVGITNALNLLDNMDGLAGGVAAIAAAFFLLLAIENGQYLVGSLSAALLGAAIGFLVYNFNPALIFMGDTGSLFIGFLLAAVGIKLRFPEHALGATWFIPIVVLGLPIFDTTLVFISRLRRGLNPLTHPGADHLSHRLVARGYSRREAVLMLYIVAGALGVVALFDAQVEAAEGLITFAALVIAGLVALYRFEFKRS